MKLRSASAVLESDSLIERLELTPGPSTRIIASTASHDHVDDEVVVVGFCCVFHFQTGVNGAREFLSNFVYFRSLILVLGNRCFKFQ